MWHFSSTPYPCHFILPYIVHTRVLSTEGKKLLESEQLIRGRRRMAWKTISYSGLFSVPHIYQTFPHLENVLPLHCHSQRFFELLMVAIILFLFFLKLFEDQESETLFVLHTLFSLELPLQIFLAEYFLNDTYWTKKPLNPCNAKPS